jgi:hypothetical protein
MSCDEIGGPELRWLDGVQADVKMIGMKGMAKESAGPMRMDGCY